MSFFKKRICDMCLKEYLPNSTTQKYCRKCGKINEREKSKKRSKEYRLRWKSEE